MDLRFAIRAKLIVGQVRAYELWRRSASYLNWSLVFSFTFVLSACGNFSGHIDPMSETTNEVVAPKVEPIAPDFTVVWDKPLIVATKSSTSPLASVGVAVAATLSPPATSGSGTVPPLTSVTYDSTAVTTSASTSTSAVASSQLLDAVTNTSFVGTVSATGTTDSCKVIYSASQSETCSVSVVNLLASSVAGLTSFAVRLFNGTASKTVDQNVTSLIVRQVSNTTGSNSTSDGTGGGKLLQYGGKLLFGAFDSGNLDTLHAIPATINQIEKLGVLGDGTGGTLNFLNGGDLYYLAGTATADVKYFKINLNTLTNIQVSDTRPGSTDSLRGDAIAVLNYGAINGLVFSAKNANARYKYYFYNANNSTVTQISNTRNSPTQNDIQAGTYGAITALYQDKLLLVSTNSNGVLKLYLYNATAATLVQVSNTSGNQSSSDLGLVSMNQWPSLNEKVFVQAIDSAGFYKLHMYDFITNTLKKISNTCIGCDDFLALQSQVCGERIYFNSTAGGGVYKLHEYNPSTGVLRRISNTSESLASNDGAMAKACINDQVYFVALNGSGALRVYVYDLATDQVIPVGNSSGSTTALESSNLYTDFAGYGDAVYFASKNSSGGLKLFRFHPGTKTLTQVTNLSGDQALDDVTSGMSFIGGMDGGLGPTAVFQNRLYFWGYHASGGYKLWSVCDRAAGCTD